jgi:aryl-alcohol dehydrogenase-like predicted oxidoreductase
MSGEKTGGKGLSLSRIGCWAFGGGSYWGDQNQRDVDAVVHTALDLGLNVFNTARMYNNGASEVSLRQALKGHRDKAFVVSKVSPRKGLPQNLKRRMRNILAEPGMDYLDMYMMYWPINPLGIKHFTEDPAVIANPPTSTEAFEALVELKKARIDSVSLKVLKKLGNNPDYYENSKGSRIYRNDSGGNTQGL